MSDNSPQQKIKVSTTIEELPDCNVEVYLSEEEWLDARLGVIGASESASIFGVGFDSPLSVWGHKVGQIESTVDSELMECGRVLQPSIIELFRRRYSRQHPERSTDFKANPLNEFSICRSIKYPWLAASLDDYFLEDGRVALIEAKNVSIFMSDDWDDDDPPLRVNVQAQHQMAVTGADRCFVVGLIGGNRLKWKETARNQEFIAAMITRLFEFHELVESKTEPDNKWIDGSEGTRKALAKLHPKDSGEMVILPEESSEWSRILADTKEQIYQLDSEKTRLENLIKSEIGDATYGLLPDGTRYNWKYQTRAEHFVSASEFRVLRHSKK